MSMVRKRLELMVVEFSKISWRISLELLLMYSMVSSRYPLFFLKHAGEV